MHIGSLTLSGDNCIWTEFAVSELGDISNDSDDPVADSDDCTKSAESCVCSKLSDFTKCDPSL